MRLSPASVPREPHYSGAMQHQHRRRTQSLPLPSTVSMELTQARWYVGARLLFIYCSANLSMASDEPSDIAHTDPPYLPKYTAAAKTSSLDPTARALSTLSDIFKKDPKLPLILNAPSMSPSDKSQIVQELQRHMGNLEKGETVKQFLKTLSENNRLGILEGVCEKFAVLMGAAKGELEMVVQSASVRSPIMLVSARATPIGILD